MKPTAMLPRERVLTAINHQEPDRVPLALCGGPYGLIDTLYLNLVRELELGQPVAPFRSGHSISYMDDRVLEKLGIDTRYCWPGLLPNSPVIAGEDDDTFHDSYGQVWKRALPYYYAGDGILKNAASVEDIARLVRWPDLTDRRWTHGLAERAQTLRENTDYFIVMRMVASHGPFQTACDLRGTENFLVDMATNPEFAHALLDKITDAIEGLLQIALQAGGRWFDMIELPGDDYAGNTATIVSPRMFQKFIKPRIARLVNRVREYNPQIKIMLHSDGAITRLIPEIISLGVDVIHPLEPLAATNLDEVKKDFGGQVTFLGGIDISHAMPGSLEDVVREAKARIAQLAPGGGYILAPSNHLQADVSPENVIKLFETAQEFGRYPIGSDNI